MKILLAPNITRDKEYAFTREVIDILIEKKATVLLENGCSLVSEYKNKNVKFLGKIEPELVISIGGDGTFLKAAHTAVEYDVPIFGFNLGNLGFLAELEKQELELVDNLFNGCYDIEERLVLNVSIYGSEAEQRDLIAINEVVIHRSTAPRLLDITLFSDNRKVMDYRADGIIVSTPTGSTGYSLSAGGPVTDPSIDCVISVPICAHSFKAYPIVFSGKSRLAILTGASDGLRAYCSLDGDTMMDIGENDIVSVKKADKRLKIMKIKNQSFTDIINKKFIYNN